MREQLGSYLDDIALDDDIKVVLLRGEGGVFSTGADMGNAYAWYGDRRRRPADGAPAPAGVRASAAASRSTARRSTSTTTSSATRRSPSPRSTGYALGGGFELALMADISVVGRATRRSACRRRASSARRSGSLHMFFYRLGPNLARRMLLTGDTIPASDLAHLSVFTEVVDDDGGRGPRRLVGREGRPDAGRRPGAWPRRRSASSSRCRGTRARRSPATSSTPTARTCSSSEGEFNFVKTRAEHGTKKAFELRDEHFEIPEP